MGHTARKTVALSLCMGDVTCVNCANLANLHIELTFRVPWLLCMLIHGAWGDSFLHVHPVVHEDSTPAQRIVYRIFTLGGAAAVRCSLAGIGNVALARSISVRSSAPSGRATSQSHNSFEEATHEMFQYLDIFHRKVASLVSSASRQMQRKPPGTPESNLAASRFLQLPREIRDLIYRYW